jgi:hypothetical protein
MQKQSSTKTTSAPKAQKLTYTQIQRLAHDLSDVLSEFDGSGQDIAGSLLLLLHEIHHYPQDMSHVETVANVLSEYLYRMVIADTRGPCVRFIAQYRRKVLGEGGKS